MRARKIQWKLDLRPDVISCFNALHAGSGGKSKNEFGAELLTAAMEHLISARWLDAVEHRYGVRVIPQIEVKVYGDDPAAVAAARRLLLLDGEAGAPLPSIVVVDAQQKVAERLPIVPKRGAPLARFEEAAAALPKR